MQAQITGVHTVFGHGHESLGDKALIFFEGGHSRLLTGGVPVEGKDDFSAGAVIGNHAAHHFNVSGSKSGAAGGYGGGDASQVGGHNIGIALHNDNLLGLGHLALSQVNPVEHLGFLVQLRFGGVEVLRALVIIKEAAGTKANSLPRNGANGPDNAAAEAVVETAVTLGEHTGSLEFLVSKTLGAQVFEQVVPATRGVAHTEVASRGGIEAAGAQEALRLLGLSAVEVAFEELGGNFMCIQQAATQTGLVAVAGFAPLIVQGVADASSQALHSFGKPRVLHGHHEVIDIAGLATTETVVRTHLRAHVKGGRALVVKRAQPLVRADTRALEAHVAFNNLANIGAGAYFVDIFFADKSSHKLNSTVGFSRCRRKALRGY